MHQNELDSILGAAMEESMEILTVNPTYSIGKEVEGKELAADFYSEYAHANNQQIDI